MDDGSLEMAQLNSNQFIRLGEKLEPTLASLIRLHSIDPSLFLALAMDDLEESAEPWIKALSELARRLREMVFRGYAIHRRGETECELIGAGYTLNFDVALTSSVAGFMRALNGVHIGEHGRDYRGSDVSEREILFWLGDPATWHADEARIQAREQSSPLILQISEEDKNALISGTPAYAVYSLQRSASRVVSSPQAVYRGLRQTGPLSKGLAFCGHPRRAYGNDGTPVDAALETMLFMVFADADGYVFDWDWVKTESSDSSSPDHAGHRFAERIQTPPQAVLTGVDDLKPGTFSPNAWFCTRGDCIFYYISDKPSFAQWVNDDLTIFWSFADDSIMTGCKVKNVARLLRNKEAEKVQRKQGYLPLAYFLGRSLSVQALNAILVTMVSWFRKLNRAEPRCRLNWNLRRKCSLARDFR
jgi:hypothetical protein